MKKIILLIVSIFSFSGCGSREPDDNECKILIDFGHLDYYTYAAFKGSTYHGFDQGLRGSVVEDKGGILFGQLDFILSADESEYYIYNNRETHPDVTYPTPVATPIQCEGGKTKTINYYYFTFVDKDFWKLN